MALWVDEADYAPFTPAERTRTNRLRKAVVAEVGARVEAESRRPGRAERNLDAAPGVTAGVTLQRDTVVRAATVEASARLLGMGLDAVAEAIIGVWRQVPAVFAAADGVVWCVDRPRLRRYEDGFLHAVGGPAVVYADGWEENFVRGQNVSSSFWTNSEAVLWSHNTEVRRVGIEYHGWEHFVDAMTLVAEADDPGNPGQTLALYDPRNLWGWTSRPLPRYLVVSNASLDKGGARRRFVLTVPSRHQDPVSAAADLFGLTKAEYIQLQRAT
jgi:hypothetical protein